MRKSKTTERGQALILIAFAIIGLAAIVGLAIDGATVFSDQRHAQNAADTAAMAAALAKVDTLAAAETDGSISTTPAVCASNAMSGASDVCVELVLEGLGRADDNGYDNFTNNTVSIYSPPVDGYYEDNDDYIQVFITSTVNTTFMKVIGRNQFTHTVQAVAFAKPGFNLADGAMFISYDPNPTCPSGPGNGGGSFDVTGSSILNLSGGGIFINSSIACGYNAPNCPQINISGGGGVTSVAVSPLDNINQKGLPSCANTPLPESFNADPVIIPDEVYWPPVPPECSMSGYPTPTKLGEIPASPKNIEEWLIYPGYYEDFPQALLVANKSHIYMKSGVYCIDVNGPGSDRALSWSTVDAAMLNGSTDPAKNKYSSYNPDGVTLYIRDGDRFTINDASPTYLDASSNPSSDYQGYLIILEGKRSSIEDCNITGGAEIDINGMIFAPYCDVTINGGSQPTAQFNAQVVGWDITISGNTTINFSYDPSNQVKIKRKVGLMK
jgi:Flp pilus assembly protein TadG